MDSSLPYPSRAVSRERTARPPLPGVACAALALAAVGLTALLQSHYGINQDTSWLIDVAERVLDGAVPYRDLIEPNPPACFLIEMPAVLLARALGVSSEAATVALVIFGAGLSLALSAVTLARSGLVAPGRATGLFAAGVAVSLLLPMQSFAQREHVAVLAVLPGLAVLAGRARGRPPGVVEAVLAGLGLGIAVAIKPVFLLGLLGPAACALAGQGPRRMAGAIELWIGAAVALAYAGAVLVFYPDYDARVLPLVTSVYLPARSSLLVLILQPLALAWALATAAAWWAGARTEPLARVLALASAGFEGAALVQGKGYPYHFLPAVMLAVLACATAELRHPAPRLPAGDRRVPPLAAAALLASATLFGSQGSIAAAAPGLTKAVEAIAPVPRVLMIGTDLRFGRMFAHDVGGVWVGSSPSNWVSFYALAQDPDAERNPRFAGAILAERDLYADDVLRGRPDVILIKGEGWLDWARRGPRLSAALADYREAGRFGSVILLRASGRG